MSFKKKIVLLSVFTLFLSGFSYTAFGNSFLKPAKFPKTFDDLSFVDKIEIKQASYEPWGSTFENGICVSNCAYNGITVEQEEKLLERRTAEARLRRDFYLEQKKTESQPTQRVSGDGVLINNLIQNNSAYTVKDVDLSTYNDTDSGLRCNPNNPSIKSGEKIISALPLINTPRITSQFGPRLNPLTKAHQTHNGIDFSVVTGTNIYSPAEGVAELVWESQSAGKAIRIRHSYNYATVYMHLSQHNIKTGDKVKAGCLIGKTGNTGYSTGPHLHYEVHHNNKAVDPKEFF